MLFRLRRARSPTWKLLCTTVPLASVPHSYFSANANSVGMSGGSSLYYPLNSVPLDGVNGPAMTKMDGSSWVVNMGFDGYALTNMSALSFNKSHFQFADTICDGRCRRYQPLV